MNTTTSKHTQTQSAHTSTTQTAVRGGKKTATLSLRVAPDIKEKLNNNAADVGMSASDYLTCLLSEPNEGGQLTSSALSASERDALLAQSAQLGRIADNLAVISAWLHRFDALHISCSYQLMIEETHAAMHEIRRLLRETR